MLAFVGILSAQKISVGVKGGYEAALSYNDLINKNLLTTSTDQLKSGFSSGYQAGAWLRLGGKKVYLQPEIALNVKSISQTMNIGNTTMKATYKTQAIEIPLLVGYRFLNLGLLSLHVNAGPKAIINAGSSSNWNQYANVVSHDFKTAGWGIDGGFGVDVLMFSLDLRYTQYLTNTSTITLQNNEVVNTNGSKQAIFLSLGWKLF